ncbi:MAG: arsenosugar biosynthesis radical SAM protein ArsS [Acidobacteria bacterium]|nr:arsenosugar biosynthesis radical SAM protein ArsS [Acidobacteriota bacterium]MCZ6649307.1 arsenosugar biosynthesis radical SAM protein ArsS [Acidobacteriota bacterium]
MAPDPTLHSLQSRRSPLARPAVQVRHLEKEAPWPVFQERMSTLGLPPLTATGLSVLQINVGRLCNQTCAHCHVDAGPDRREIMSRPTMEECLRVLEASDIPTVDITGGAPELNPNFRWLVERCRELHRHVMDRCNLTVLTLPSQNGLVDFLARQQVEIVASLPCYQEETTDRQRGQGVFSRSIAALRILNQRGYGRPDSGLILNLVANPVGASLPPPQETLEQSVRRELERRYDITFNHLYTITNVPIGRFLENLMESGTYDSYMERLVQAFNPATVDGLMCRTMISVSWDGRLFDCDFNQMLDLEVNHGARARLADFEPNLLARRRIITGRHCYGCTAGSGSSCGGSLT